MSIKVLSETPITMSELREELGKIKKRDEELNFRANKAEEYLNMFATLDSAEAKELKEKIAGLNVPRLKDEHIVKIVDLLPGSPEEVKSMLSGYTVTVNNDNLKRIADAVSGYIRKKK